MLAQLPCAFYSISWWREANLLACEAVLLAPGPHASGLCDRIEDISSCTRWKLCAVLRTKTCVSQFVQEQHMSSVGAAIVVLSVLDMLHQAAGCMITAVPSQCWHSLWGDCQPLRGRTVHMYLSVLTSHCMC
jgi:hypothetical protein